jgi:D-lactate dehydrogenase
MPLGEEMAIPSPGQALDRTGFLEKLARIIGGKHVLDAPAKTRDFTTGYRFGRGEAIVVRPGTLREAWQVLKCCIAHGVIIVMQSANTGLTGGSTPNGVYDRAVVVINTLRIAGLHLIDGGNQVLCLPGTTLFDLEKTLKKLGREPHSVIGSSCIGASVFGGICNNSGGALVRRGPAFTQLALYARLDAAGDLQLINHLGIKLGNDPDTILRRVEAGDFSAADIVRDPNRAASDPTYAAHVRNIDADTPARFNADPARLFEASGSAGKIMLFAVRLDTFPQEPTTATFYVGSNNTAELTALRRDILRDFTSLPVSGEYIHRDAFDIAAIYGKDIFLAIRHLGTDRLPALFELKNRIDRLAGKFSFLPRYLGDHLLQAASRLFPQHLPTRMRSYRDRFEHHLILKMAGGGIDEAKAYFASRFPSATGDVFECTPGEAEKAFLQRFAVASAAVRYRAVHRNVEDIVALDIALRRNDDAWFETLPDAMEKPVLHKLYYGHFFCHVFHQDYIIAKGHDPHAIETEMLALLDTRGAEYPAEHNVGHLYHAKPALQAHYRALDPCNCFNPGVGKTTRQANWA